MATLLKIKSSGMWHPLGERFLHLQGQAIQNLDCLALHMKNFNPSKCRELLTQQQGVTSYRTWISFFLTAVMSQSSWHITLQTLQWPLCKSADTPCYLLFSDIFSPYLLPWALICMNHQNQFLALGRKIGCLNHGCHTPSLVVNNKEENGCILLCLEL